VVTGQMMIKKPSGNSLDCAGKRQLASSILKNGTSVEIYFGAGKFIVGLSELFLFIN